MFENYFSMVTTEKKKNINQIANKFLHLEVEKKVEIRELD